jgi:hypothetical protein
MSAKPTHIIPRANAAVKVEIVEPNTSRWNELRLDAVVKRYKAAAELVDGSAKIAVYERALPTIRDKEAQAGIDALHLLKVVVMKDEWGTREEHILVAAPARGNIKTTGIYFREEDDAALSLGISETLPPWMIHGTCTPFLVEEAKGIGALLIADPEFRYPKDTRRIGDLEVDVSLGGSDEIAQKIALRVRYGALVESLRKHHPQLLSVQNELIKTG